MDLPANLLPTKIQRADYAIGHHFLTVMPGVTAEMVAQPEFWVHLAQRSLKVFDRIDVVALDGSFEADLRVVALDPRGLWAQVRVLRVYQPEGTSVALPRPSWPDKEGYTVEFDRVQKWRIVRGIELVAKDYPDEETALEALVNLKAAKPRAKAA